MDGAAAVLVRPVGADSKMDFLPGLVRG